VLSHYTLPAVITGCFEIVVLAGREYVRAVKNVYPGIKVKAWETVVNAAISFVLII